MAFRWQGPGGDKTINAAFLLIGAVVCFAWGGPRGHPYLIGLGVIFAICGVGLWLDQQWARWFTVFALVAFAAYSGFLVVTKGVNWVRFGTMVCGLWTAWQIWADFAPAKKAEEDEEEEQNDLAVDEQDNKALISLALLLKEPRYLEAAILAQMVSAAWGETYDHGEGADEKESRRFVVGESPTFLIQSPRGVFMVHNFGQPYFSDLEALTKEIKESRLRKAIEEHKAWMAVDLMIVHEEGVPPEAMYPWIAKLIAELAGPDCTAIYHPQSHKINVWDSSLEEKLRGPNAMEEFARPAHPPVITIDDDDPRMQAAVAEARSRWPEFVEAFKQREGANFSIKAPVTRNEKTEFIWIEVTGLEPEFIHGTLGNEPVALENLKLGDRIEVPLADLNDWAFLRGGKMIGLFTAKVLTQAQNEAKSLGAKPNTT